MPKVVLEFTMQGSDEEAWAVAEGLERAAVQKGFFAVSGYVVQERDRGLVEDGKQVPMINAVTVEPQRGGQATAVSPDGRSTMEDPSVRPRHYGET